MKLTKICYCLMCISLLMGCEDTDLGMRYQKTPVKFKNFDIHIFCYRFVWGLNGETWFISENKEICTGFDSTKDVSFGEGSPVIYYDTDNDTLNIYSDRNVALPEKFSANVKAIKFAVSDFIEYEEKFTKGLINKISFDTVYYEVPCTPIPKSPANTMKFQPQP